jgi:hypothetical protein
MKNRGRRRRLDFRPVDARRRRGRGAGACTDLCASPGGHSLPRDGPRRHDHASSGTDGNRHGGAATDRPLRPLTNSDKARHTSRKLTSTCYTRQLKRRWGREGCRRRGRTRRREPAARTTFRRLRRVSDKTKWSISTTAPQGSQNNKRGGGRCSGVSWPRRGGAWRPWRAAAAENDGAGYFGGARPCELAQ